MPTFKEEQDRLIVKIYCLSKETGKRVQYQHLHSLPLVALRRILSRLEEEYKSKVGERIEKVTDV